MLRLILFLFLLYLLYLLLRGYHFGRGSESSRREQKGPSAAEEELVLDPQCQSYVPKKDAISQAGKFFCSEECARLYLSKS